MQAAHRRAHRRIWQVLALLLPLAFLLALGLRPGQPVEETRFEAPLTEEPKKAGGSS